MSGVTTEERTRIQGLREAIRAANDWSDAASLWSIQNDLDWLLANAERFAMPQPRVRDEQIEEFMGWLFRDGGAEPPRRDYDAVEQRLRLLVDPPDYPDEGPVPTSIQNRWNDAAEPIR